MVRVEDDGIGSGRGCLDFGGGEGTADALSTFPFALELTHHVPGRPVSVVDLEANDGVVAVGGAVPGSDRPARPHPPQPLAGDGAPSSTWATIRSSSR